MAAAVFVFAARVKVVVLHQAAADVGVVFVVFQSAVVVVAAAAVPCVVAAVEFAVALSAVVMFEAGSLVEHDVAAPAFAAGPRVLPTAFVRGHCFVGG